MIESLALPNAPTCFRRLTSPHRFVGPGEDVFANWLTDLGINFAYEPYLYELVKTYEQDTSGRQFERIRKGFCPDFLIHALPDWPRLHVEITGARCRTGKINRMILTRRHYRIHTVLIIVGSHQWKRIEREPEELLRILRRAGKRAKTLSETFEPAA